jgi:hypothetical protein
MSQASVLLCIVPLCRTMVGSACYSAEYKMAGV